MTKAKEDCPIWQLEALQRLDAKFTARYQQFKKMKGERGRYIAFKRAALDVRKEIKELSK